MLTLYLLAATTAKSGLSTVQLIVGLMVATLTLLTFAGVAIGVLFRSRKDEIIKDQESLIKVLQDSHAECDRKVAELQGRVSALESDFIDRIARAVAQVIAEHYEARPVPKPPPRRRNA